MLDPKLFDDLARRLVAAIPDSLKNAEHDLQRKFHDILQAVFAKLDLVTREEFDVQCKVLARTRQKIEDLEKMVEALEKQVKNP